MKKFRVKYRAMKIDDGQLYADNKTKAKKMFLATYKKAHGRNSNIKIISVVEDR